MWHAGQSVVYVSYSFRSLASEMRGSTYLVALPFSRGSSISVLVFDWRLVTALCCGGHVRLFLMFIPISVFYPQFSVLSPFQFPFSVSVSAIQFQRFTPDQGLFN